MEEQEVENHGIVASEGRSIFKLYKYRWCVLFLFCFYACVNFLQYFQYSIITNIIARYYNIETVAVSWTSTIFMIGYIVFFIPASYLMEKYDLRKISILSSSLTACGVALRLFSVSPDHYYIVLIGQTLTATAQVFVLSLPTKLTAVWFGSHEVSTATAFAVLGTQLGVALGSVIPPYVVENHDDINEIGEELFEMIKYNAIFAYAACALVVLFFEAKPPTPPSYSQLHVTERPDISSYKSLKKLVKNRDYVILLLAMGMSNGIWNAAGVHLNTVYLNYFPDREKDAGLAALVAVIAGGCIGSLIFGFILDRWHRFKMTTFTMLLAAALSFIAMGITLQQQSRVGTFVTMGLFGFFLGGSIVVGFEYTAEVTYPEPETTTLAYLNAAILSFGLAFSYIMEALFTAIGFFWTMMVEGFILLLCPCIVSLMSTNLRRLNTNQAQDNN